MEPCKHVLKLGQHFISNYIPANEITKLNECLKGMDNVTRDVPFDCRKGYLANISALIGVHAMGEILTFIRAFESEQSDHQMSRLLDCQISQTTRPPDMQTIRPFQTTSDQSDHQTTRSPDYQTISDQSRPVRPPDQQIFRVSDQSDKQTSRLTDYQTTPEQSNHQMSRLLDCQISQTTRSPDHQTYKLLDHSRTLQTSQTTRLSDHSRPLQTTQATRPADL